MPVVEVRPIAGPPVREQVAAGPLIRHDTDPTVSPTNEDKAADTDIPSNYAFLSPDGYRGLLLHVLSPRLAAWAYPLICSQPVEAVVLCLGIVGACVSTAATITPAVPLLVGLAACRAMYLTILHRLFVLDVRVLGLLGRQFDCWYQVANGAALFAVLSVHPFKTTFPVHQMVVLVIWGGQSAVFSDVLRLPPRSIMASTLSFGLLTLAMCGAYLIQLSPYADYDKLLTHRVNVVGIIVGRLLTLGAFSLKFLAKLVRRPEHYVILFRPMSRRDLDEGHSYLLKGSLKVAPPPPEDTSGLPPPERPTHIESSNYAYSPSAGGYQGLILHALSPRLAEWAYPYIASKHAGKVVGVCTFLEQVAGLPVVFRALPVRMTVMTVVGFIPWLHRFALIDLPVLWVLLRQFDTWFLTVNWFAMLVTINRHFILDPWVYAFAVMSTLSVSSALILDAVRLPPAVTIETATGFSVTFMVIGLMNAFKLTRSVDWNYQVFEHVNVASFHVSRLITLGLFFIAQAVGLRLRPDVYVVIRRPLARHEAAIPVLSGTLRAMTMKLNTNRPPRRQPQPPEPQDGGDDGHPAVQYA